MLDVRYKKAFLDANVLFPNHLRSLFLDLTEAKLISLAWSPKVIEEWQYNARRLKRLNRSDSSVLTNELDDRCPEASVVQYEDLMPTLRLPDPDDRHVLAAAIKGKCQYIVTFNMADFRKKELRKYDLVPIHPQNYLLNLLEKAPTFFDEYLSDLDRRNDLFEMLVKRNMDVFLVRLRRVCNC